MLIKGRAELDSIRKNECYSDALSATHVDQVCAFYGSYHSGGKSNAIDSVEYILLNSSF